jgi:hypothetical protein
MIDYKEPFVLQNIELVELDDPHKIAIWIRAVNGDRLEGGTFDKDELMRAILKFYSDNY